MGVAQAEIDYLEPPAVARRLQQQVLRLQVPVRDVVLVQVVDTIHLLGCTIWYIRFGSCLSYAASPPRSKTLKNEDVGSGACHRHPRRLQVRHTGASIEPTAFARTDDGWQGVESAVNSQ